MVVGLISSWLSRDVGAVGDAEGFYPGYHCRLQGYKICNMLGWPHYWPITPGHAASHSGWANGKADQADK